LLRTPWRNPLIESAFQIGTFDPSVTTRPLRPVPAGRGRGVAADVQGYPDADCPVAGAARTRVRGAAINATNNDGGGAP